MRRTKKEKNKVLDNRGKEDDLSYKSWIKANEFSSLGATCTLFDYKTGRHVELLSQGEKYYWYLLRWDDTVETICEQYLISLQII